MKKKKQVTYLDFEIKKYLENILTFERRSQYCFSWVVQTVGNINKAATGTHVIDVSVT